MTLPLHRRRLPDEAIVRSWLNRLNGFGARLTGNTAHRDAIDFIESELRASGLLPRGGRLFCVTTVSIVCTIKAPVPVRAEDGLDPPCLHGR
jgi:hypothetical protein